MAMSILICKITLSHLAFNNHISIAKWGKQFRGQKKKMTYSLLRFHLFSDSPYSLPYKSYDVSSLVLDQQHMIKSPKRYFSLI